MHEASQILGLQWRLGCSNCSIWMSRISRGLAVSLQDGHERKPMVKALQGSSAGSLEFWVFLSLGVCLAVSSLAVLQSRSFRSCAIRSNWASSRRTSDLQVVQELRNWTSLHVPIKRTRSWQLDHVGAKDKSYQWLLRTIPHFYDFWLIDWFDWLLSCLLATLFQGNHRWFTRAEQSWGLWNILS